MKSRLTDFLDDVVKVGEDATGYQFAVADANGLIDQHSGGVDALSQPYCGDSLIPMYCAAKNLLVAAVAVAVSTRALSLDDRLDGLLPIRDPRVGLLTIADLLSHRSGSGRPSMVDAVLLDRSEQLSVATRASAFPHLPRGETRYSEASAWLLLSEGLSVAVSMPFEEYVVSAVLSPLGLTEHFHLESDSQFGESDRRRVSWSYSGRIPRPQLIELSQAISFARCPGFGGFGTATGQALLMAALLGPQSPISIAKDVRDRIFTPEARQFDHTLDRFCRFSLGFMAELSDHGFGGLIPASAVAQAGLGGMTAVVGDPASGVAIAVHTNGLKNPENTLSNGRPLLWNVVATAYKALWL